MRKPKGHLITLDDYNNNAKQFYYIQDIKNTLSKFRINNVGKKKELQETLFKFFDKLNFYNKNIDTIISCQQKIRKKLNYRKVETQGEGILDKSKCSNQEDFYTLDNIMELEDKYFFSYRESNHIYFFDIRSFKKLLQNDSKNPYTRNDIPDDAIKMFNKRIAYLKENNIVIEEIIEKLSKEQIFNNRVLTIFQKIDMLNVIAGGVDIKWFLDLNILQLKTLYKSLEDIWNYRTQLSPQKKHEIVPNESMFPYRVMDIYNLNKKKLIQKIILKEIDKLVSSAESDEDKRTGGYLVLTGLVEVSIPCMEALPWLVQVA
tara:strand:- start:4 stop:954 length:951 start_codon:yes stop_codon:yes gene_type:complete